MMRKIAVLFMLMMFLLTGCGKEAADVQTQETAESLSETNASAETESQAVTETQQEAPAAVVDTVETESFAMDYCKFGSGDRALIILPGLSIQSVMGNQLDDTHVINSALSGRSSFCCGSIGSSGGAAAAACQHGNQHQGGHDQSE